MPKDLKKLCVVLEKKSSKDVCFQKSMNLSYTDISAVVVVVVVDNDGGDVDADNEEGEADCVEAGDEGYYSVSVRDVAGKHGEVDER